jgi:peptidoglycan/LPS O-acetylase OafA/YrhL
MANGNKTFYLPWIDGLRAVAALSVVVHHSDLLAEPSIAAFRNFLGWFGVDLFLVLSAFLLSRLLLIERETTGDVSILNFYIRRALRIWPLYLSFVTLALLWGLIWGDQGTVQLFGWYVSHLTFTQNIEAAYHGYTPFPFSSHLWTIALEEQAYLLIPIATATYFSRGHVRGLKMALAAAAVGFMLMRLGVVLIGRSHPFVWVSPLRADTFLFGIFMGLGTSVGASTDLRTHKSLLSATAALLILSALVWMGPPGISRVCEVIGYPVMAFACCLIVYAVSMSSKLRAAFGCRPMRHLGKISYGIYVFHIFALTETAKVLDQLEVHNRFSRFAVAVVVTVLLAHASYRLLERPFLLLKNRFTSVQSRPA